MNKHCGCLLAASTGFVPMGAVFVENITKTYCTIKSKMANFSKFFASARNSYPKSGDKYLPNDVTCAGWCIVSEAIRPLTHNGARKLYNKCAIWLILKHRCVCTEVKQCTSLGAQIYAQFRVPTWVHGSVFIIDSDPTIQ